MTVVFHEIKIKTPTIITIERHKSIFHDTASFITDSAIKGALCRQFIMDNVKNQFGKCKEVTGPNQELRCDECSERPRCQYYQAWVEDKLHVYPALFGQWDLVNAYPLLNVQSGVKSRKDPTIKGDRLLTTVINALSKKRDAFLKYSLLEEKLKSLRNGVTEEHGSFKADKVSGLLRVNSERTFFEELSLEKEQYQSLAVNYRYKSAARELLYSVNALMPSTPKNSNMFSGILYYGSDVAELFDDVFTPGKELSLQVGLGRSKNWGSITLRVPRVLTDDQFIVERSREIKTGLESLKALFSNGLEKNEWIATLTLLSDAKPRNLDKDQLFGLLDGDHATNAVMKMVTEVMGESCYFTHKIRTFYRPNGRDYTKEARIGVGSTLALLLAAESDVEGISTALASAELWLIQHGIGHATFNHPFHYRRTTINFPSRRMEPLESSARDLKRENVLSEGDSKKALYRQEALTMAMKVLEGIQCTSSEKDAKRNAVSRGLVRNLLETARTSQSLIEFIVSASYTVARSDVDKNSAVKTFFERFNSELKRARDRLEITKPEDQKDFLTLLLEYIVLTHVLKSEESAQNG